MLLHRRILHTNSYHDQDGAHAAHLVIKVCWKRKTGHQSTKPSHRHIHSGSVVHYQHSNSSVQVQQQVTCADAPVPVHILRWSSHISCPPPTRPALRQYASLLSLECRGTISGAYGTTTQKQCILLSLQVSNPRHFKARKGWSGVAPAGLVRSRDDLQN